MGSWTFRPVGNERVDMTVKLTYCYSNHIYFKPPIVDLKKEVILTDMEAWLAKLWPYTEEQSNNIYFVRVNFESSRPWFKDISRPRREVVTITRLRSTHIATADHLCRFYKNANLSCGCGSMWRSLENILYHCPIFEQARLKYIRFLNKKFPGLNPREISMDDLMYNPDEELVIELGAL